MADLDFLTRVPFAHRGLHGAGVVENSRAAFEAAIAAGHGVETDVQVSKDGEAMVFHDYDLDRMTSKSGPVIDRKAAKLEKLTLKGSDETIPRLPEMLALVDGRTPVMIELKAKSRKVKKLCRSVAAALADYRGEVAIMSFNPEVGRWFMRNAPAVVRGLVITEKFEVTLAQRLKGPMQRSLSVFRAEPQFIAYDIRDLPSAFAEALREKGMPMVTWTVRTEDEHARAAACTDQIVYETL